MRITEGQLRKIIREELLEESYQGFKDRTANMIYKRSLGDPTFEEHPVEKEMARTVKRIWNEEADHDFMDSLVKIHWVKAFNDRTAIAKISNFLSISRRNEIATTGYLPDSDEFLAPWGDYGVVVKGRTTFAANSMDTVASGYGSKLPDAVRQKYKNSGVPKRPFAFRDLEKTYGPLHKMDDYVLDRDSFDTEGSKHWQPRQNEFIVDNWKPVAIIRTFAVSHLEVYFDRARELIEIEKLVDQKKITQDQFEAIVIVDDLDNAVQRALSGASPDEIRSSMEAYDPPDSPRGNPWMLSTYEYIKPSLTFTAASPGLRKFGLPIVDRKLNTVWSPLGS
jgi:hypothetical protein